MFKALNLKNNSDIIILDIQGDREAVESLRAIGRQQELACPECKELVRVRAGEDKRRRWHFAHLALGTCPLHHESAAILEARRLIYSWLQSKKLHFVTLEYKISINDRDDFLPRPVDCYATTEKGLQAAYWIFEHGIRNRHELISAKFYTGAVFHWVFLISNLKIKKNDDGSKSILLTPTERDCLSTSKYNQLYAETSTHSLHYIDADNEMLITIRGVSPKHSPQEFYFGKILINNFIEIQFDPKTGEFVHPGEFCSLQRHVEEQNILRQRQQEAEEQARKLRIEREKQAQRELYDQIQRRQTEHQEPERKSHAKNKSPDYMPSFPATVICSICGETTDDWVVYNPNICKKCLYSKKP